MKQEIKAISLEEASNTYRKKLNTSDLVDTIQNKLKKNYRCGAESNILRINDLAPFETKNFKGIIYRGVHHWSSAIDGGSFHIFKPIFFNKAQNQIEEIDWEEYVGEYATHRFNNNGMFSMTLETLLGERIRVRIKSLSDTKYQYTNKEKRTFNNSYLINLIKKKITQE